MELDERGMKRYLSLGEHRSAAVHSIDQNEPAPSWHCSILTYLLKYNINNKSTNT
jgi:hypothetical protein